MMHTLLSSDGPRKGEWPLKLQALRRCVPRIRCIVAVTVLLGSVRLLSRTVQRTIFLGNVEINRPVTLTTDPSILYPATQDLVLTPGDAFQIHPVFRSGILARSTHRSRRNRSAPSHWCDPSCGPTVTQAEQ